jgi:hypothetical protein
MKQFLRVAESLLALLLALFAFALILRRLGPDPFHAAAAAYLLVSLAPVSLIVAGARLRFGRLLGWGILAVILLIALCG